MSNKRSRDLAFSVAKKKRRSITLEDKINIVKRYESGESLASVARSFGLATSTVNTIAKDKERIKEHAKGSAPMMSTVITKPRSGVIYEMEKHLIMWIEEQNQRRIPVSRMSIREKAKSLYEDLKAKKGETEGSFIASNGWYNRFKARANLRDSEVSIEVDNSANQNSVDFPDLFAGIIMEGGYLPEQVFILYETSLLWKRLPEHACMDDYGKLKSMYLQDQNCVTVLLGGNSAGDLKLKPLLVSRPEDQDLIKVEKEFLPVVWMTDSNSCITSNIFEAWFWHHLIPQLEGYSQDKGVPFNILLILDSAVGHPLHVDNFHPQIKVVLMPPRISTALHPLFEDVIAKFKVYYLCRIFTEVIQAQEKEDGSTLECFLKMFSFQNALVNISAAWEDLDTANMNGIWRKLCPQLVVVGKELVDSLDEVTAKLLMLAHQADLYLEIHDVKLFLESNSKELTNEELMELQAQRIEESENNYYVLHSEPRVEPPKDFTMKKLGKAFRHIEVALMAFQKMDPVESRFANVSASVMEALSVYQDIYNEKKAALNASSRKSTGKVQGANESAISSQHVSDVEPSPFLKQSPSCDTSN